MSYKVAIEFLLIGSRNEILCCIKHLFLKVSAKNLLTSIIFIILSATSSSTATPELKLDNFVATEVTLSGLISSFPKICTSQLVLSSDLIIYDGQSAS